MAIKKKKKRSKKHQVSVVEGGAGVTKKKRGRPRKNAEGVIDQPAKKKRGRPRKNAEAVATPVKKKRGRPRSTNPSSGYVKRPVNEVGIREGTISEVIYNKLLKGATKEKIVEALVKAFPDRDPTKMAATLNSQLSRMPKERGFRIEKDSKKRYRIVDADSVPEAVPVKKKKKSKKKGKKFPKFN